MSTIRAMFTGCEGGGRKLTGGICEAMWKEQLWGTEITGAPGCVSRVDNLNPSTHSNATRAVSSIRDYKIGLLQYKTIGAFLGVVRSY